MVKSLNTALSLVNILNDVLSWVRRVDTNICVVWVDPELATPQEVLTRLEARTDDGDTSVKGDRDTFSLLPQKLKMSQFICYKKLFLHHYEL